MSSEGDIPKTVPNHVLATSVHTTPSVRREGALVIGATAASAFVLVTLAVGAMAIGKMATGQLFPGRRQNMRRRHVNDLHVARATVVEMQIRRLLPWR
jgi:hypothetical protein